VELYFGPEARTWAFKMFFSVHFECKPWPSGVSLEFPGLENIPQGPGYQAELAQNHDVRKAVLATLLVLKWSEAIFWPRNSKVTVQKVLLCPFTCKSRPSGVSLESPALENILQFAGNRAEVDENHDAGNAVSAILSVLKWSGAIFQPTTSKVSVQKVLLCPFYRKTRPSGISLASKGLENIPQAPENPPEVFQNHDARKAVSATLSVLK